MSALSLSGNPLYDIVVRVAKFFRDELTFEFVKDFIQKAPNNYDEWWRNLLSEAPQHILIETGLICFIIWLIFIRRTVDPAKAAKNDKLSQKEQDELIESWVPEPLVPTLSPKSTEISSNIMIIEEVGNDNHLKIKGVEKRVLNMSSFDFLGLSRLESVKIKAREALEKYGCGSCGPRGFYGTIDLHLTIEESIAKFMGTEEAISYSDGASTVSSAIPAFCKKGDLLLVDDACSEPILTGTVLSRSTVKFFKHNDMDDLRRILKSIQDDDKRLRRDATEQRRFIIAEGLYRNTGDLCLLKEVLRLKEEFFYRLILDESLSFGTLGKTGRGLTEHLGVPVQDVEIITVAMDTALGSVGGLCLGTREVVDHQRLSGAGYCFSASAPPFLSAAAAQALKEMQSNPKFLENLRLCQKAMFESFSTIKGVKILNQSVDSPVFHLVLDPERPRAEEEVAMQRLAQDCVHRGVGVVASKFALAHARAESSRLRPSIRICASAAISPEQVKKAAGVFKDALAGTFFGSEAAGAGGAKMSVGAGVVVAVSAAAEAVTGDEGNGSSQSAVQAPAASKGKKGKK